jgi:hypothetical protein
VKMHYKVALIGTCFAAHACAAKDETPRPEALSQAIIHGSDDRLDYFELSELQPREAGRFTVALVRAFHAAALAEGRHSSLPTWRDLDRLCPGERFADQPAVAFCSGVLAESDLVLTAKHCIDLVRLENIRVVFGYYFAERDELVVQPEDVHAISTVVATSAASQDQALDFAWLRLSRAVEPARRPASLYARGAAVAEGDPILTVGAAGGTPLKWDMGARVHDARDAEAGYFVADTDTFHGSSGSPALDSEMNVVGIFTRGSRDFADTDRGCRSSVRRDSSVDEPNERFTYVHHAVAALCRAAPQSPLCASDCAEPCQAPQTPAQSAAPAGPTTPGCSITRRHGSVVHWLEAMFAFLSFALRARRRRSKQSELAVMTYHQAHRGIGERSSNLMV